LLSLVCNFEQSADPISVHAFLSADDRFTDGATSVAQKIPSRLPLLVNLDDPAGQNFGAAVVPRRFGGGPSPWLRR
jgi:hypothetical protein